VVVPTTVEEPLLPVVPVSVKAWSPVTTNLLVPTADKARVLADVPELMVSVSMPVVVKPEPAAVPLSDKVIASAVVLATAAVAYVRVVVELPPVMVVFTRLPTPVTVNVAPFAGDTLLTCVKPVTPVKSRVVGLGEGVKFNTSMPTREVADCVGAVPVTVGSMCLCLCCH